MTATSLFDILRRALGRHPDGALCVAFSGGPDSTALLHALASLPEAHARGLRALHVDHGLHPDSPSWADHCAGFCRHRNVPLDIRRVIVTPDGKGLEAAAREARYAAFARALQPDELLLTAHHRDDQAETVLLKLLRGGGPEGLGGMRAWRPFAGGRLWRPLLDTPRDALTEHLRGHALDSIDDPSNRSARLARGFLRHEILPQLAAHWPNATRAITHSARLNREADDYIRQGARQALETLCHHDEHRLDASGWLALHPALQGPVLDLWLHALGLPAPSLGQRQQLLRQARHAADDRVPLVQWPGGAVHVWRQRLYAHQPLPDVPADWNVPWNGEPLTLPGGGKLQLLPPASGQESGSTASLTVHLGLVGVRLRPVGDDHTRHLRDLFQRAGIPPWQRRLCPLIHDAAGRLLAVADLWQTRAGHDFFSALGRYPQWARSG